MTNRARPSNLVVTEMSEDERLAELEAKLAAVEAEVARRTAKPATKPSKPLSRRQKAQALVDWFIVDNLKEAYYYLEDMGE